jgi:hypothetical protein
MDDFYTPNKINPISGEVLRLQLPLCDKMLTNEVTGDFSLPDYQPEIKRLLRVTATVQPPSHYIGGGSAEFSGTVDFCIIYAGNDGGLYCFPASSDYTFRTSLEAGADFDLHDGPVCYALCEPEAVSGRVGGPRRLNVKCRLRSRVRAYGSYVMEEKRRGALPEGCGEERLWRESEVSVSAYGMSEPFVVSDEILPEGEVDMGDEWRIVSGDAQVMVGEVTCSNGRVGCRGDVVLKLLMQREGTVVDPICVWRKLPFDREIIMDGATVGSDAAVNGCCTELNLSMDEGKVLCEAEIVLQAGAQARETVAYTADWYATGAESSCSTSELIVPRALRCVNGNITQSESWSTEEAGLAADARVIDVAGQATVESVSVERGRYVINGHGRYTLIAALPDGEMMSTDIECPWRYVVDGPAADGTILHHEGQARVLSARVRMDGKRPVIDAEIGVCLRLWSEEPIRVVSGMTVGEPSEQRAGESILCYPSREDTLWSVSKRYGVGVDALVKKNRLNDEKRADDKRSLADVRVIGI